MKTMRVATAVLALGLLWHGQAGAEGRPFVGIDLGVSEPTNANYRGHVETGGTGNPFAGYMFNDYLGVQGQLHFTFQEPDNHHWGFAGENDTTGVFGGTIGPRLSIPLGDLVELYGTGQGGGFTGMHGRVNHTAPGFSVGGGLDFNVTRNVAIGAFGRWNRAYMAPRPFDLGPGQLGSQRYGEDIRWATAGIGLRYTFGGAEEVPPPPPPPPPAPVAKPAPPPPPVKKQIVLRSVNFDFNKATLRKDAVPILDEALQILKEQGSVDIIVQGHTDSVGSDEYNMKLSRQRADTVRDYFVKHGIAATRITAEGLGESKPVASNKTAGGRAENRRVELHIK
jgi:outer membrane protein OmpA-like peptidoglycan-associated protein